MNVHLSLWVVSLIHAHTDPEKEKKNKQKTVYCLFQVSFNLSLEIIPMFTCVHYRRV